MTERLMYDLRTAAEQVCLSVRTIQDAVKKGELAVYKRTSKPLIRHADLIEWATTERKATP